MAWRLVKTAIFVVLVPGTVALWVPQRLRNAGDQRFFPLWQDAMGIALFGCGVLVLLWCAWDFAVKGLGTPAPIDAPKVLVVKGLYRYTRNPMYVGVAAIILGQAVYYGSASIVMYFCVVAGLFHVFVLLYEEPTLRRTFGAQYEDYCRSVPRWLLPIGKR